MSRTKKNEKLVDEIFQPDKETGYSSWKTREEIDLTELKLGKNGNIRQNTPWTDKYEWKIIRVNDKPTGKPVKFRTVGFSNTTIKGRDIHPDIKKELLETYKTCRHCGSHTSLCIDHKLDTYKDNRVLNIHTQNKSDFQVLCNKCNKDEKHQDNVKEKKTGKLHSVKRFNIAPYCYDKFDYPWELAIKKYDEDEKEFNCKMYTYWYDVDQYKNRYAWFIKLRYVHNDIKKFKLIP
jgi:hypothetical protein